ncbi:Mitotic spindle checkpoint component mad2 [Hanseniaspora osmophila]
MSISLKGSTRSITEFFDYSINSILYQRAVYPPEDFHVVKKYDLNLMVTHDEELKLYIRKILLQVHRWLLGGKCNRLVLCIVKKTTGDVVEKWEFLVEPTTVPNNDSQMQVNGNTIAPETVSIEETQKQIRALIRQITASVTFLPELSSYNTEEDINSDEDDDEETLYTFNVLAYTQADAKVPLEWGDSDSKEVVNGESVKFKDVHTTDYKVGAQVTYRF